MRHFFAALIYATAWAAVFFTGLGETDAAAVALVVGASLVAGLLSGSWWALVLCVLIPALVATDPCDNTVDRCEIDWVAFAAFYWAPASAAVIACGVGLRRFAGSRRS